MVCLVIDDGWTVEADAEKFQVDAKTVRKWRDLPWRPGARVIDLANVAELRDLPGYEGLYW